MFGLLIVIFLLFVSVAFATAPLRPLLLRRIKQKYFTSCTGSNSKKYLSFLAERLDCSLAFCKSFCSDASRTVGKSSGSAGPSGSTHPCPPADDPSQQPDRLNCRIQLTEQRKDEAVFDAFAVQIRGFVDAPADDHRAVVEVSITDITDGPARPKPVCKRAHATQPQENQPFIYTADIGRLPARATAIEDWLTVAVIDPRPLLFAHKGRRCLQFTTSILSHQDRHKLACRACNFLYQNPEPGHIDFEQNARRTRTLAVALAFDVAAADKKLALSQIRLIKEWARSNVHFSRDNNKQKRKLEKALNKTVKFFRTGHSLDTFSVCAEITEIAPLAVRYDILDLCLHVAAADGTASQDTLNVLRNLADWLKIDKNRFREMMQKTLSSHMTQVHDLELLLGLTSDMTDEQTRHLLNAEYRKWHARVTNADPAVKSQADHMLNLIAQARATCSN